MARPSGRTNSVKGLVGVAIIRLVGRRAETPLRRGQGKSDLLLLLCRLERFRFGAFSLCWHPDLATVRASLAVFGRASCWGLLFEQDQTKNARHSLPFDDVEPLNRKIFRPTSRHGSPIRERGLDGRIRIRIREVNQLNAGSGLPSPTCCARWVWFAVSHYRSEGGSSQIL